MTENKMTILENPDKIIPRLSYRSRQMLNAIGMFNWRAESSLKRNWGFVHVWKNNSGWQSRRMTRPQVRPLWENGLVELDRGLLRTTPLGLMVIKRLIELKKKGATRTPLKLSDETGQYVMHF